MCPHHWFGFALGVYTLQFSLLATPLSDLMFISNVITPKTDPLLDSVPCFLKLTAGPVAVTLRVSFTHCELLEGKSPLQNTKFPA